MMTSQTELTIFLLLWFAAAGILLVKSWKRENSSGLTIFYIANLTLIHFFGALVYVLPWYGYGDIEATLKGFRLATYGIIAFGIGNLILAPYLIRFFHIKLFNYPMTKLPNDPNSNYPMTKLPSNPNNNYPMTQLFNDPINSRSLSNLSRIYLLIGVICYIFLFSFIGHLPTLQALVSVGQQLVVIGICLACWKAWCEKNKRGLIIWLLISLVFPLITIIFQGFIGYGVIMTLIILLFTARFFRPKWKVAIAGLLLAYLGLSFYQSYMRDRDELRAVVWGGAPIIERVEELGITLSKTEWFNPLNTGHLDRIDDRLNQNFLVGKAVDYLQRKKDFAHGETLWDALIALVPRIIWPDKPVRAGSPGIVSEYTGLIYSPDTSVGVGQVMEFYINFGTASVTIGFLVLGIIISIIDVIAGHNLLRGNWRRFTFWIIPGLAFINVGGSLVEVTATAGAGIVVAYLVSRFRSAHYPLLLALIYLFVIGYIGFKYILPLAQPYLEVLILMAIAAIVVKKVIKSLVNK